MRPARLLPALALVGCSPDLIAPEDPSFEDLCTLYLTEGEQASISRWQLENCETIAIFVVRFGALAKELHPISAWDSVVEELLERVRHDRKLEEVEEAFELEPEEVDDVERAVLAIGLKSRRGPMPKGGRVH